MALTIFRARFNPNLLMGSREVSLSSGSFLLAVLSHHNSPPSFQIESQPRQIRAPSRAKIKTDQTMKRKLVFAVVAALLVATGLWLARSSRHSENSSDKPTTAYFQTPESQAAESDPGQTNNAHPQHRPP